MKYNHNKKLVSNAKALRKNMTKEERHLWYDYLRSKDVRFIRQKIIGNYIVDFYCAKANLVVELDGSQHYEDKGIDYDAARTEYLEQFNNKIPQSATLTAPFTREGDHACVVEGFKKQQRWIFNPTLLFTLFQHFIYYCHQFP